MLKRNELAKWLEGTGIVLPPPLSLSEKIQESLQFYSEQQFIKVLIVLHILAMPSLLGGLFWALWF
ncbi:hypothetical protein [Flectobacillus major]|jgi:hypothetical protein|uniref:hypothetical protein n=1 Tax=Flectobacillus major TaxID=103 RepID=UPI0004077EE4|nr:hypothetical protein [Flectobacillus major]